MVSTRGQGHLNWKGYLIIGENTVESRWFEQDPISLEIEPIFSHLLTANPNSVNSIVQEQEPIMGSRQEWYKRDSLF